MSIRGKHDIGLSLLGKKRRFDKRVASTSIYDILLIVVIIIFVVVFIALFFVYWQSNQTELESLKKQLSYTQNMTTTQNMTATVEIERKIARIQSIWSQFWDFCTTDTFKTIIVSVLLTILLAALGKIFKIKEAFEQRIHAQRQIRIEKQKQCIDKTEEVWEKLYRMVTEVRFWSYKKDGNKNSVPESETKDKKKNITEILIDCKNFACEAEEVVNKWHFVFPILPKICEELNKDYRNELEKLEKNRGKDIKKEEKELKKEENKLKKEEKVPEKKIEEFEKKKEKFEKKKEKFDNEKRESKESRKEKRQEINQLIWRCKRPSEIIVFFINILYNATLTVAYSLNEKKETVVYCLNEKTKIENMQRALGVIQDVINNLIHQNMLAILKCSVEPQDGYGDREQDAINRANISTDLETLYENCIRVKNKIKDIPLLPEIKKLHNSYTSCQQIMENRMEDKMSVKVERVCRKWNNSVQKIEDKEIATHWETKYSEENLLKLAKHLSMISLEEEMKDKTKWRHLINKIPTVR